MRATLQYFLFSGMAWFVACAIVLIAAMIPRSRFDPLVRVVMFLALGLGFLAGTPVSWWLAIPLIACVVALAVLFGKEPRWLRIASALLVAAALIQEARYFFVAPPRRERPARIVVIGDSLSSGGFGEERTWPEILSSRTGIAVENRSQASEKVGTALAAAEDGLAGSLVVVAVGGNDMLDGTPSRDFARDLDRLLSQARGQDGEVVMLEVPTLPGKWIYAAHQRRLSRKHGVTLIPRRFLAGILTAPGNVTGDGLHLSRRGHEEFARGVEQRMGW